MPKLTLTNRIYLSMIAFLVLSFLVIGGVTINFFRVQNQEYHEQRLLRKEATMMGAIEYYIASQDKSYNPIVVSELFQDKIDELADVNNLDLNIYSLEGKLLLASNPNLFQQGILKYQLDTSLVEQIIGENSVYIDEEQIDTIALLSSYQTILDLAGYPIGIAHIPYFDVNKQMSIELSDFLKTLSETYLLFFVLALAIAFYLAKYITRSLKTIADSIKATRMNQKNKPLVWNSKDEIGVVVEEYNRMLEELEKSAEILARTERESAWREMAKQVAHEIKNPLTPMKLTVQQAQRSLKPTDPDFKEKLKRFTDSMVDQIDTLSSIASSFSRFAALPTVDMQQLDLRELLISTTSLYQEQGLQVKLEEESCLVNADREQIIRVVHNLIQNAYQSIPDDRPAQVKLSLSKTSSYALVEVSDNGAGISEDRKEKIFEPSITTKTGGMGLGLAIVKRIVENHKGEINFLSEENNGSTFYFKLPLANE